MREKKQYILTEAHHRVRNLFEQFTRTAEEGEELILTTKDQEFFLGDLISGLGRG